VAGRRINLSELADEPVLDARVPRFTQPSAHTVQVDQLAPNPLNTRNVLADPGKIASIAESMRLHGQLQPCTVVRREAFLAIFPEHEPSIGAAAYVQVTGARRRAAAVEAGIPTLDIVVKDNLAATRAAFVSATAVENIEREDYDPIEEALAVKLLVKECGSGKAAAAQLSRTPPWVTQRLNLLKLNPEMQALLRSGEIPIRDARNLATLPPGEQLSAWRELQAARFTAVNHANGDGEPEPTARPRSATETRSSPAVLAIRRLGGTPPKIAASLREVLSPEDLKALIKLLRQAL
jgi:ParB family transcriptional regulator, chromosome partitioning protein